jgi:hypothetical protein
MDMATVRQNLIAAKALIDTPEKWVKGALKTGDCLCAMGAVHAVLPKNYHGLISDTAQFRALQSALPDGFRWSVPSFNDDPSTTHADIMALFDRAIASLPLNAEGGDK